MGEVLVYRVENEIKDGPYGKCYFGPSHNDPKTHPSPQRDEPLVPERDPWGRIAKNYLDIYADENCGLKSLRDVEQWFEGHGKKLADAGFSLVALAVDENDLRVGRKQVVFPRSRARLLHTMDVARYVSTKETREE